LVRQETVLVRSVAPESVVVVFVLPVGVVVVVVCVESVVMLAPSSDPDRIAVRLARHQVCVDGLAWN
jgi:hypothetical protein